MPIVTPKPKSRAIVQQGDALYWKEWDLLEDDDLVAFYDGDLSRVFEPDGGRSTVRHNYCVYNVPPPLTFED